MGLPSFFKGWQKYHQVWAWLFLAWFFCYLDRSLTGPIVSWMIKERTDFFVGEEVHALGGIIGSMFFAGYMLIQFPSGYLGDRYGRRTMIFLSTVWAGIATTLSALTRNLQCFVAMRVLTGLGEGAYYSNDRGLIAEVTPVEKKGMAMGVVFVGLALGLTTATIATPWIIDLAVPVVGLDWAWTVPFLIFGPPTILVGYGFHRFVGGDEKGMLAKATSRLIGLSLIFFLIVMVMFQSTLALGWSNLVQALVLLIVAFVLVLVIYLRLGNVSSEVLKDRALVRMYLSSVPLLYTLWFFGFWALLLVSESSELGLSDAALYAGMFGLANVVGYPLGGKIGDIARARWGSCRLAYVVVGSGVTLGILLLAWIVVQDELDLLFLAADLSIIGVFFAAMQTLHMTMTSDLAPVDMQGQAFGMWNLVAEVGAILSPVLSGTLRDVTGGWFWGTVLTAILIGVSVLLVWSVPERPFRSGLR